MKTPCPYCAQADTHKDHFGYCKKYNCFRMSGAKGEYEVLKEELLEARWMPTSRRNQFDYSYYNPREEVTRWTLKKIAKLLGFVPAECYENKIIARG